MEVWPGGPYPLGASYDGSGTNFALFSEIAEGGELCLFGDDNGDDNAKTRVPLIAKDALVCTPSCRASSPASVTATASTVSPTRPTAIAAIPASCLSEGDGRAPFASINFVTAHDGFTMRDLVSYNDKRNEANGEGGSDGEQHNRSWNCGAEGPTDDPGILALRARQERNLLATMLLSQGVTMILHGDEVGRTQNGSNTYCQDNETSWIDWANVDEGLLAFTRPVIKLRTDQPVFRRRRFFTGREAGNGLPDIAWLGADGTPMGEADWTSPGADPLAVYLNGRGIAENVPRGEEIRRRLVPDPLQPDPR